MPEPLGPTTSSHLDPEQPPEPLGRLWAALQQRAPGRCLPCRWEVEAPSRTGQPGWPSCCRAPAAGSLLFP